MNTRITTAGACVALITAGCADTNGSGAGGTPERVAISSQGAALTAQENTERALRGVLQAGGFLAESAALADGLSALSGSSESCSGQFVTPACEEGAADCDTTLVYEEQCETIAEEVTNADLLDARQEMHDALDELIRFLRDEVFTEANLEFEDSTTATYALPSSIFCGDTGDDSDSLAGDVQTETDEIDLDCEADFATLQPRLRLSSPGAGDVDIAVLLTDQRHNPITMQLYDDRLGLSVDLGEVKATLDSSGQDLGTLETLDGEVGIELVRNAATDYSLRVNLLRDLEISAGDPGKELSVLLAASTPTTEVRLDGVAQTVTGTLNFGALNLVAPLSAFASEDEYDELGNPLPAVTYTGVIDAVLGGINGSLAFDGNTDSLTLEGLGLGDVASTIFHDDARLLQLDLNPDHGRRFDLHVESTGQDSGRLTFSPTLDVRLALGFSHIADQVSDIPGFLLNDTIRIWFEGEEPSVDVSESGLRVAAGTLQMTSATVPDSNVTVGAGMCLVEAPESDVEPASLASTLHAEVCE
jgi:hypothetical protein